MSELDAVLTTWRNRLEAQLEAALPDATTPPSALHAAMRYATLDGGKRLRACLVYLAGSTLGVDPDDLDAPAMAVELIHAYSLVHDDLPCMDDDDLRRGKPSVHKAWDEPTAMLVGDALQSLAFELLAASKHTNAADMVQALAKASGSLGMAGGQALDLGAVGQTLSLDELKTMHALKTGALIEVAVELGVLAAGEPINSTRTKLKSYASAIGLGFQIRDDILDIEGDTSILGKEVGSDAGLDKPTYPSLLGIEGAKQAAQQARDQAVSALEGLNLDTRHLHELADYVTNRIY